MSGEKSLLVALDSLDHSPCHVASSQLHCEAELFLGFAKMGSLVPEGKESLSEADS